MNYTSGDPMQEIVVMNAEPTPKAIKHIQAKVAKSECLCCSNIALKRGLCHQCYYKWRTIRAKLSSASKRAAYDSRLIRLGRLLVEQGVRRFKKTSVFSSVADELE